jgi:hypothetical protein
MAGGTLAVGLSDGDVKSGVADGVIGGFEAACIAQFGEDRRCRDRADTVELPDQRAATGLTAGEGPQCAVDRHKLTVELVEQVEHP